MLSLFHFGDSQENVKMGARLLQSLRKEILDHPTKEKLKLLRDIALLYGQVKTESNTFEMMRAEIQHSIYLDTLMGKDLPSEPLKDDLKRLADLIQETANLITSYQGFANIPAWLAPLTFAFGGGAFATLMITGAAIFSNFRSMEHLKALGELTPGQKFEILSTLINLEALTENIEDIYTSQLNTKLYRLVHVGIPSNWIEKIKNGWTRFSLEIKYSASTEEKIARVVGKIFGTALFVIDVLAFVTAFTALGVVSGGAVLMTGKGASGEIVEKAKEAYILNKKLNDLINSIYVNTQEKAQTAYRERKFTKYWEERLNPQIDAAIAQKSAAEKVKIDSGKSDQELLDHYGITPEAWKATSDSLKTLQREIYYVNAVRPSLQRVWKEAALTIYAEQSKIADPKSVLPQSLLKGIEKTAVITEKQNKQIKLFLDDWECYKNNPDSKDDDDNSLNSKQKERKKSLLDKHTSTRLERFDLSSLETFKKMGQEAPKSS